MVVIIHKVQPYHSKAENIKNIIQELFWTTGLILCVPFMNNLEEEQSTILGSAVISVFSAILLLNIAFVVWNIKEQFQLVKAQMREMFNFVNSIFCNNKKKIQRLKINRKSKRFQQSGMGVYNT